MGRNSEEIFSFVVWEDEMCRGLDKVAPTERNNWRCDLPKPTQEKEDASYRTSVSIYSPWVENSKITSNQNSMLPEPYCPYPIYIQIHTFCSYITELPQKKSNGMWRNKLHTASQCFVADGVNAALYTFAIHVNRIFTYYPLFCLPCVIYQCCLKT